MKPKRGSRAGSRESNSNGRAERVLVSLSGEAAARYLKDCIGKVDTADLIAFHIELLDPWIGDLGVDEVYDETLQPFKDERLKPTVTNTGKAKQISLTTLNRSLEIVRRILNLCARSYRHPNRMTYLARRR
jgi:hypothetical protein